jgi:predicted MFS family arabinose efflux permease
VSRSIVGNSWFWFVGAIYLTQIPAYAKEWMHGDETVVTLILTVFSVGIALGSMLCEKLSGRKVEIGLVPFGSFGLTVRLLLWWHSGESRKASGPQLARSAGLCHTWRCWSTFSAWDFRRLLYRAAVR